MERELNIIAKMQFIEDNKEILKDSILEKVEDENVAILILNMLLDNKTLLETVEYEKLISFIKERQAVEKRNFVNTCDIIGTIKSYISKIYRGNARENMIVKRVSECEKVFEAYQYKKASSKIMIKKYNN